MKHTFTIRKSRRADNTSKILLRIHYQNKNRYYPIIRNHQNIYLTDKQFKQLGRSTKPELVKINEHLLLESERIDNILSQISTFSFEAFETLFNKSTMLLGCFDDKIKELKDAEKFKTADYYEDAKRTFSDIHVDKVDDIYINKYIKAQNSYPGAYLRALRHILISNGNNTKIKIKSSRAKKKIPLDPDELQMLKDYKSLVEEDQFAVDFWMASYYAAGANYKDLVFLKWAEINNGWILKNRMKTGVETEIPINDNLQNLIDKLGNESSPYVFGMLRDDMSELEKKNKHESFMSGTRKRLKKIAKSLGFRNNLTPYVARHTQASVLKHLGYSTSMIKNFIGHESETSTQVYTSSIRTPVLREMANAL